MVFRVGLTGGIASGKTTVSNLFQQLGVHVIDADPIARDLLNKNTPCYHQVVTAFGPEVLLSNGDINRRWLRDRIFSNAEAKKTLETILHPVVREQMLDAVQHCDQAYCILSIPLLTEAGMQDMVDRVLVVDVAPSIQINRLQQRDGASEQQAMKIVAAQAERQQRLAIADDIIDNDSPAETLLPRVEQLHQQYLDLATSQP